MYSKTDIDNIKQKIDMVAYLEKRGTTLNQTGSDMKGLCPLHNENSPSFHVRPLTNTFHCFGCGKAGDIINLIMELDGYSFTGAIQEAAEVAGIELEEVEQDEEYKARQRIYRITKFAAEFYREQFLDLPLNHPAKQNLSERNLLLPNNDEGYGGLTDEMIGFAPDRGLVDALLAEGFRKEEILIAGLAFQKDQLPLRDVFRNRLVWTIYDIQGRPIGFSARRLLEEDKGPKYLNSTATPLYNKSSALLNLHEARKPISTSQKVYVVEGNADVMALKAVGVHNVVAACGTAFAEGHVQILNRLSAAGKGSDRFEIIFCFDGDAAGVKAAKTVFEKNKNIQLNSYVVRLTDKDPCDLRLHGGDDALKQVLGERVSLIEFILYEEFKLWDMRETEQQIGFFNRARDILAQVGSDLQRNGYVRTIASWSGVPLAEVQRYLRTNGAQQPAARPDNHGQLSSVQERLLAAALQYPVEYGELSAQYGITPDFFHGYQPLAAKVFAWEPDITDPEVARLMHSDLQIMEERKREGLITLTRSFLKLMYNAEVAQLNSSLATVNLQENPEGTLFEILSRQQGLKSKYSQ
jgi:DNA primase